ncbi:MAG TPA: phage holin family protein [Phenylobacterium sp.]|nr:phage holin family protein [Phenylobacterium sp.]
MLRFLVRLAFASAGLALAAHFVPGVSYDSTTSLVLAALLLGVFNAILRPILFVLTLPLTILTLGLFLLVLNAAMIGLAAFVIKGFVVDGLVAGILAAIVTGVVSWIGAMVIGDVDRGHRTRR